MANRIYPLFKQALMSSAIGVDLVSGSCAAMLIDTEEYTFSAADQWRSDVSASAVIAISSEIDAGKRTVASGVFDCSTVTWVSVTGDQAEAIIFFVDSGSADASRLVSYLDTGQTGLPVTPNGGDITFTPSSVGVFAL